MLTNIDQHPWLGHNACDDLFAKSGGRALSSLIAKYNVNKNFNYDIFTHLFKTCIAPVILYGSEACG